MNTTNPLQGALLIVLAGMGLGIGFNLLHPDPLPWKAEEKTTIQLEDPAAAKGGEDSGSEEWATIPPSETSDPETHKSAEAATKTDPADDPKGDPEGEPAADAGASKKAPAKDLYADIPESEFPIEIFLAKTKEFYDRGGLLVLDAREEVEYAEGHIKGAVSAYADQMMGETDWLEATAKDPRPIMVYCGGGECDLSLNLGFEIARMGHRKVLIFMDGYPAWEEAGYPVDTGEVP